MLRKWVDSEHKREQRDAIINCKVETLVPFDTGLVGSLVADCSVWVRSGTRSGT
jgi:hypothetical protein